MNTPSLKTFAQEARRKLRQQVGTRLDYWLESDSAEHRQFAPQIKVLQEALKAEGREALVERVAYTWFNRLAALRYMDANGFHPFGARVITPATEQQSLPELLQQSRGGALEPDLRRHLASPETFDAILSGTIPVAHPEAEAFRLLVFAVCHYYHGLMPFLFEPLGDATEILLPADLLSDHSIIADFRENLPDSDCQEVEVIGWLYQFYISEKKDAVMARKSAVPTEDIPAVTQLFTPHWIVRYLVENSLGRLWLLNRPHSRLRQHMPYYIEGEPETEFLKISTPEDIRLCDPAVGSGHMLTYAFDLLYLIYEEEGYDAPEIPSLILRHNLHGLEICPRAAALAAFALTMKARSRDKRFFRRLAAGSADAPLPHVVELQDIRFAENELRDYIHALGLGDLFNQPMLRLLHQFEEAKNFGSLIQPCLDERAIADVRRAIEAKDLGGQLFLRETHLKVLRVLEQAEALTQGYHVVVANPPYMGGANLGPILGNFLETHFVEGKYDLFAAFMLRGFTLAEKNGFVAMVTMQSWMFTTRYLGFRNRLFGERSIVCLAHLESGAMGIAFGTAASVWRTENRVQANASFSFTTTDDLDTDGTPTHFPPQNKRRCLASIADLSSIPERPVVYWASPAIRNLFVALPGVFEAIETREGLATADNGRFVRNWPEVGSSKIQFNCGDTLQAQREGFRWFPYVKGGEFRRWFGNHDLVVDWEDDGERVRQNVDLRTSRVRSHNYNGEYAFRKGLTWSGLSSGGFSVRYVDGGCMFDAKGPMGFPKAATDIRHVVGFLNSCVSTTLLEMLAPTMDFKIGQVLKLPLSNEDSLIRNVVAVADECIAIARADWDNFETSWDFRDQPLLRPGLKGATLEASWRYWEAQSTAAIRRMQELETENNRLFIAAYGLDGELQPEVPEEQITLARAEARRDMAAFLSYAVGCMMGRYSPDHPGLILADAGSTVEDYLRKVRRVEPVRPAEALAQPEGVVADPQGAFSCFGCGCGLRREEALFVIAGMPEAGSEIHGRALIYCARCGGDEPRTHLSLRLPLAAFSLSEALQKNWASREGLEAFLGLAPFGRAVPARLTDLTFAPDEDGIIPVLEGEWFPDDVVARTRDFLRATFGEATLVENVRFIEESVGKDLRKYFASQFYKDHLQTYKKRPIYWMISSPEGSFQALIYLHRYTKDTLNVLLDKYIRAFIHKLEERHRQLTELSLDETKRPKARNDAQKEASKIQKMLKELRDWDRSTVLPLAQQRIALDLDDGVKVNYQKFPGLLVKIPGLEKKEEE